MTGPSISRGAGEGAERRGRGEKAGIERKIGREMGQVFPKHTDIHRHCTPAQSLEEGPRESHICAMLLREQKVIAVMMITLSTHCVSSLVQKFFARTTSLDSPTNPIR